MITIWILYLSIDNQFVVEHPYSFAFRETCSTLGERMVKNYKYESYRCVKDTREIQ